MRPLTTWLVVGALAVLGLFAVRDTFRGAGAPASSPTGRRLEKRLHPRPAPTRPPRIVSHDRLAAELRSLGAEGVLYLTDASCRRFLLRIPALVWTTPQGLPGPDCTSGTRPVLDERFGVAAEQVASDTIEVGAEDWRLRFQGTAPAFTPAGTLTFIRDGRLYAWTVRCPPGTDTAAFRGLHTLERCPRRVSGAPSGLREIVWLSGRDFAAVAGQEYASALIVVRDGRTTSLFRAIGARMGGLEASPSGRYLAVRVDGNLFVFDARRGRQTLLPAGADQAPRAIAWSPDSSYAVVASERSLHVYRASRPWQAVTLPLAAVGIDWR